MHLKISNAASVAAIAGLALALPGVASAKKVSGTVVHKNAGAHSFVVAQRGGKLVAVHAKRSPKVGRVVKVTARKLRNGTYAAKRVKTLGVRKSARIRGTVTYVSKRKRAFVVSARGVSLLVRHGAARRATARAATVSAPAGLPAVGTQVLVTADLSTPGEVAAKKVRDEGEDTGTIELEGVVQSVDLAAGRVTISADDDDESGGVLTVVVPTDLDVSGLQPGDQVAFFVTVDDAGTFTAVGFAKDGGDDEADNADDCEGDTRSDDGEHHHSDDSGADDHGRHGRGSDDDPTASDDDPSGSDDDPSGSDDDPASSDDDPAKADDHGGR